MPRIVRMKKICSHLLAHRFFDKLNDISHFDLVFVTRRFDRVGVHDDIFGAGDEEEHFWAAVAVGVG